MYNEYSLHYREYLHELRKQRLDSQAELRRHLSAEQLVDYNLNHAFNVIGSDGRRYRITERVSYSVCSERGAMLCAVPQVIARSLNPPEQMLATKLVIEGNARYFRRKANFRPRMESLTPIPLPRGYPKRTLRQKLQRFRTSLIYALLPLAILAPLGVALVEVL